MFLIKLKVALPVLKELLTNDKNWFNKLITFTENNCKKIWIKLEHEHGNNIVVWKK